VTVTANAPRTHYIGLYVSTGVFLGSIGLATRLDGLLSWLLPLATGLGLLTRVLLFRDARRHAAAGAARPAESAR
jgi:hypothetical protein